MTVNDLSPSEILFIKAEDAICRASAWQPATKESLKAELAVDERTVRRLISELRARGLQICSNSTTKGYWRAATEEEYKHTRAELVHRLKEIAKIVIAMDQGKPATDEQIDEHVRL